MDDNPFRNIRRGGNPAAPAPARGATVTVTAQDIEDAKQRQAVFDAMVGFVASAFAPPRQQPQQAPTVDPRIAETAATAAKIVRLGQVRRNEGVDSTPRDAQGRVIEPQSLAGRILAAGRRARGEE